MGVPLPSLPYVYWANIEAPQFRPLEPRHGHLRSGARRHRGGAEDPAAERGGGARGERCAGVEDPERVLKDEKDRGLIVDI